MAVRLSRRIFLRRTVSPLYHAFASTLRIYYRYSGGCRSNIADSSYTTAEAFKFRLVKAPSYRYISVSSCIVLAYTFSVSVAALYVKINSISFNFRSIDRKGYIKRMQSPAKILLNRNFSVVSVNRIIYSHRAGLNHINTYLPRNFYRRTVFLRLKADTAEPFLMSSGKNRRKSVNILITQIGIYRSISSAS